MQKKNKTAFAVTRAFHVSIKNILLTTSFKHGIGHLSSLLFPSVCSFCDKKAEKVQRMSTDTFQIEGICRSCLAKIPFRSKSNAWIKCIEPLNDCDNSQFPRYNINVIAVCDYEKMIRKALVSMKFYEAAYMKDVFGSMVRFAVASRNESFDGIVPIPLHPSRMKERGYNQAELIARKASDLMRIPLLNECLYRQKNTKRQSEMEHYSNRLQNVDGAFICINPEILSGKKILLLDDILTSGETMISAANAIKKSLDEYEHTSGIEQPVCEIVGIALASSRKERNSTMSINHT